MNRRQTADGGPQSAIYGLSSFNQGLVEATATALDLCLACKGCKAECPTGVDMAKLKYEFENQYYQTHRRPLRDYVFGYFHIVAALASSMAPISNALINIPALKNIASKTLQIAPQRPFPKFANKRSMVRRDNRAQEKVIFLSDPFSRYVEPNVEQAAFDVLSRCGYDIQVLPVVGAGASLLSKGMLGAAKRHAGNMLDGLNQIDPTREAAIVGIEPPEIYTLKHDYLDLLPERAAEIASRVAHTWLLDEYLLRSKTFSDLCKDVKKSPDKIFFHPHCHQRAESPASDGLSNGANATLEVLRACGYEVELSDAGCCGMAGTFGYEAEHYHLSMQVGELKLFPNIRSLATLDCKVVSTGAACRMQIRQGAGVDAVHPLQVIAEGLKR